MTLLVQDLHFSYGPTPVLGEVNLGVGPGEMVVLLGPNGCGKSTLVKVMTGLLKPRGGRVWLDGQDLGHIAPRDRALSLAYVPQSTHLTFSDSVFDTVLMGRSPHFGWSPRREDLDRTTEALEALDLGTLATRPYAALSGGQQQRALIARALVQATPLVLLDEPTSALDLRHQLDTLGRLRELAETEGRSMVVVLHDLTLAARFATRILLLSRGRLVADGTPSEVLTPELVGSVFGVEAEIVEHRGQRIVVPKRVEGVVPKK